MHIGVVRKLIEHKVSNIGPGESFNDVPVFDDGPNPASAQAMGTVTLYGIRKGDFKNVLRDYPQVAFNVIKVLSDQVRQLV